MTDVEITFARGFRLHMADGDALDGAEFPSGRGFVFDHREQGLATVVASRENLDEVFPGSHIEWAPAHREGLNPEAFDLMQSHGMTDEEIMRVHRLIAPWAVD